MNTLAKTPQMNIAVARHNIGLVDVLDAYADKRNLSRSETVFWLVREQFQRDLIGTRR